MSGFLNVFNLMSQNDQLSAQADVAKQNADILRQNAAVEEVRRERELRDSRRRSNLAKGAARNQASALGISGGSLHDILADFDMQSAFEGQSIVDDRVPRQQSFLNQEASERHRAASILSQRSSALGMITSYVAGNASDTMLALGLGFGGGGGASSLLSGLGGGGASSILSGLGGGGASHVVAGLGSLLGKVRSSSSSTGGTP